MVIYIYPRTLSPEEIINADKDYFGPFWNKIIQSGFVNQDQLKQALVEARKSKRHLLQLLEELTQNKLSPELVKQYKQYHLFELKILYGVDCLDSETEELATEEMTELIEYIIYIQVCRRYKLLPIKRLDKEPPVILIAMVNPDHLEALDTIKQMLRSKNLGFQRVVITEEDYDKLLQHYYSEDKEHKKLKAAQAEKGKFDQLIDVVGEVVVPSDTRFGEVDDDSVEDLASVDQANESPVIALVNKILIKSLQDGSPDIHVEPQEERLRVRFRKNDVLQEVFDLPKHIIQAVVSRIKVMADLDIGVRDCPQQGKITRVYQGRKVAFLVNIVPSKYGENICLDIVNYDYIKKGLDFLTANTKTLTTLKNLTSLSQGLIIFTGASKVGKTSTGYSILNELKKKGLNIYTLENIIKFNLSGITQLSSFERKHQDLASNIQAILPHNPDVIYINKLEDADTAKMIFSAVSKGKLILAEIDENSINNVLFRLLEWGIKPERIASSLKAIIYQRLLHRVCESCRILQDSKPEILTSLGLDKSNLKNNFVTTYHANSLTLEALEKAYAQGSLCKECRGMGYKGMIAIYEIMEINNYLQNLMVKGVNFDILRQEAIKQGMITLFNYSLNLVQQGITTLEEIQKVLSDLIEENLAINKIKDNPNQKYLDGKIQEIEEQLNNLIATFELLKRNIY